MSHLKPGEESEDPEPTVDLPLTATLDLHHFRPGDAQALVREYLRLCRERGILSVHVIHGKGTGALRRTVHATLSRMTEVHWYRTADEANGGWGATLVQLVPLPPVR